MTQEIITGDCLEVLSRPEMESRFDLCCIDPPYAIGIPYDVFNDRIPPREYLDWCRKWIGLIKKSLKPAASFWLIIGDSFASELDVICRQEYGFYRRNWVVWHYSFGVNSVRKFTPSHTHIFYYVCDHKNFVFNADAVKVPSLRQSRYSDKRAKPGGRLPNDVWLLDSKEVSTAGDAYLPTDDAWFESRVCGTFKERVAHPTQMPIPIMERMIAVSSNPGDKVLDPMCGSGSTLVAARNLGRDGVGVELSADYAKLARERVND